MSDNRKPEWQVPKGIGFPQKLVDAVEEIALVEKRTFSQMCRCLIEEALAARKKNKG